MSTRVSASWPPTTARLQAVAVLLAAAPLAPLPLLLIDDADGWLGAAGQLSAIGQILAASTTLLVMGAAGSLRAGWARTAAVLAMAGPVVLVAGLLRAALNDPEIVLLTGVVAGLLVRPAVRTAGPQAPPAVVSPAALASAVALGALVIAYGHDVVRYPLAQTAILASLGVAAAWGALEKWRSRPRGPATWAVVALTATGVFTLPSPGVTTLIWALLAVYALRYGGIALWSAFMADLERNPARLVVVTFVLLSAVGAVLLSFPISTTDGHGLDALTAMFTAVSAVCVTGLSTIDVGTVLSGVGHVILAFLIQIGALGIMSLSAFAVVALGGGLALRRSHAVGETLGASLPGSVPRLLFLIVVSTLVIEAAGAVLLFGAYRLDGFDTFAAARHALFHSISAFCNAGFSLHGDSLASRNGLIGGVVAVLIVLGGLGFTTLWSVARFLRGERRRLGLQARVVLRATVVLTLVGALGFLALELDGSLAEKGLVERLGHALFQSVTTRTAGFNTIDIGALQPATVVFVMGLMFIGASPGGTGGGIKTTTFVVLLLTVKTLLTRREELEILGREVPRATVVRAVAVVTLSTGLVFTMFILLLLTQRIDFAALLFETVSAFGTVGLSMGATGRLDAFGQVLIILLMLAGRTGPLTIAILFGGVRRASRVRRPTEDLPVG